MVKTEMRFSCKRYTTPRDNICIIRNIATVFDDEKLLSKEYLEFIESEFPNTDINSYIENYILYKNYGLVLNPIIVNALIFYGEDMISINKKYSFIHDDILFNMFRECEKQDEYLSLMFIGLIKDNLSQHRASIIASKKNGVSKFYFLDTNFDFVKIYDTYKDMIRFIRDFYDNIVELSYLTDINGVEPDFSIFKLDFIV